MNKHNRSLVYSMVFALVFGPVMPALVSAQVVPDNTLGTKLGSVDKTRLGSTTPVDYLIIGGTKSSNGDNLFHSFSEFSIDTAPGARFVGQNATNIIARVTGVEASTIAGYLGSDASLWLMNPAGIVINDGAVFDVAGSLHLSTGNAVNFSELPSFTMTTTISEAGNLKLNPTSFGFLDPITANDLFINDSNLAHKAEIKIVNAENLHLSSANDIRTSVKATEAPDEAPSIETSLILGESGLQLEAKKEIYLRNISIESELKTSEVDKGKDISIDARRVALNRAVIDYDVLNSSQHPEDGGKRAPPGGNIVVRADRIYSVSDSNESHMRNIIRTETIQDRNVYPGDAGNISLIASETYALSDILIGSYNYSYDKNPYSSKTGSIIVESSGDARMSDAVIASFAGITGAPSGSIRIIDTTMAGNLTINNSRIRTGSGESEGPSIEILAGDIQFASDSSISGAASGVQVGGIIRVVATANLIIDGSNMVSETAGRYDAGSIILNGKNVSILSSSNLSTSAVNDPVGQFGQGGNAGSIFIEADSAVLVDDSKISSVTKTEGNAGNIELKAMALSISNSSSISVDSQTIADPGDENHIRPPNSKNGLVGNISFKEKGEKGVFTLIKSSVSATSKAELDGAAGGGKIEITFDDISLNDSAIKGEMYNTAIGGLITLNGNSIAVNHTSTDPDVAAISTTASDTATSGNIQISGGNVTFSGERADIVASTSGEGNAGNITISGSSIQFLEGADIRTETSAAGNAGNISLFGKFVEMVQSTFNSSTSAKDLNGFVAGNAGEIELTADYLAMKDNSVLESTNLIRDGNDEVAGFGSGDAGNVSLTLASNDQASKISGSTIRVDAAEGPGTGGTITIVGEDTASLAIEGATITATNKSITDDATKKSGVNIVAGDLSIDQMNGIRSTISAEVDNRAEGGAVVLDATSGPLSVKNTEVTASTSGAGKAGNIDISGKSVSMVDADVNSESTGSGAAGNVTIAMTDAGDTTFENATISVEAGPSATSGGRIAIRDESGKASLTLVDSTVSAKNASGYKLEKEAVKETDTEPSIGIFAGALTLLTSLVTGEVSNQAEGEGIVLAAQNDDVVLLGNGKARTQVTASTSGTGKAGNIDISGKSVSLTHADVKSESNNENSKTGAAGSVRIRMTDADVKSESTRKGKAGNVTIAMAADAGDTTFENAKISVEADSSAGGGGTVLITGPATHTLTLNNTKVLATNKSEGTSGIKITAGSIVIAGGESRIAGEVAGGAEGGNIELTASGGTIDITGDAKGSAEITASTTGKGRAGNIDISGTSVSLTHADVKSESSDENSDTGEAGSVTIRMTDADVQSESNRKGKAGNVTIAMAADAGDTTFENAKISVEADSSAGGGGTVLIKGPETHTLTLKNTEVLASNSSNRSKEGTSGIEITAGSIAITGRESRIAGKVAGVAEGGNIVLTANSGDIAISGDPDDRAEVAASTSGSGNAGDIELIGKSVALEDVDIKSESNNENSKTGAAGSVTISMAADVKSESSDENSDTGEAGSGTIAMIDADVKSESTGTGAAGSVTITMTDAGKTTFNNATISVEADPSAAGGGKIDINDTSGKGSLTLVNSTVSAKNASGYKLEKDAVKETDTEPSIGIFAGALNLLTSLVTGEVSNQAEGEGIVLAAQNGDVVLQGDGKDRRTQVTASTSGAGNAGNIDISGTSVLLTHADVKSESSDENSDTGEAGSVTIRMTDAGDTAFENATISVVAESSAKGGGTVFIQGPATHTLTLNNTKVLATNKSKGTSGIKITAGSIAIAGGESRIAGEVGGAARGGNIVLTANTGDIAISGDSDDRADVTASTSGSGNAGDIELIGKSVALEDVGIKSESSDENSDTGKAGSVTIAMTDADVKSESSDENSKTGAAGSVTITMTDPGDITFKDATISVEAGPSAAGGGKIDINDTSGKGRLTLVNSTVSAINASGYKLENEAEKETDTEPSIGIFAGALTLLRSLVTGEVSNQAEGEGIVLAAQNDDVVLLGNGKARTQVTASTSGTGKAGNIDISGKSVSLTHADVKSESNNENSKTGAAGSVTISMAADAGDTTFENATISVVAESSAGGGGTVFITGPETQTLTLKNTKVLASNKSEDTLQQGTSGIEITAGSIVIAGGESRIAGEVAGVAEGGNIELTASGGTIDITGDATDSAKITASTSGTGQAGNIDISGKSVLLVDTDVNTSTSMVDSEVLEAGDAGSISVSAGTLAIDGSTLESKSTGSGAAGNVTIAMTDAGDTTFENAEITVEAGASAEGGGTITVTGASSDKLTLKNTQVLASNQSLGTSGIAITAGSLVIEGGKSRIAGEVGGAARGGNIVLTANTGDIAISGDSDDRAEVSANTSGSGNAGSIFVTGNSIALTHALVSSASTGSGESENSDINSLSAAEQEASKIGNAGNINFIYVDEMLVSSSTVSTSSESSSGGNINVIRKGNTGVGSVFRANQNSRITAEAKHDGGNITIAGMQYVLLEDGTQITASAENGGNITIIPELGGAVFIDHDVLIDASGTNRSGSINISDNPLDIKSIISQLNVPSLDVAELLAQACAGRAGEDRSSLVIERNRLAWAPGAYEAAYVTPPEMERNRQTANVGRGDLLADTMANLRSDCALMAMELRM